MATVKIKVFKDRLEAEKSLVKRLCGGERVCLALLVPEELQGDHSYYLRFSTAQQAKRGGMSVTGRLRCVNGVIRYRLPRHLAETENLEIQLLAVKGRERMFSPVLKRGLGFCSVCRHPKGGGQTLFDFYDINDYAARKKELPF